MELKQWFPEVDPEKRLGLGCMRLPKKGPAESDVDTDKCIEMVDRFMEAGFNYFDTARVYHGGASEKMIKTCIADRYPRESFVLTDKLSDSCFKEEKDIRPLFEDQLKTCGVEYFDFYLMHALNRRIYPQYQESRAFEIAQELKTEGKIRHVGISFHDDVDFLEQILNDHPEIEIVQIQLNYFDMDSPSVQSAELYELCDRYDKPVLIMEPVRGGGLAKLPPEAQKILDDLYEDGDYEKPSAASYALRFAASFPRVAMVLSGMGSMEMIDDNIDSFTDFEPIDEEELEAIEKVAKILKGQDQIPCTGCKYCVAGCPMGIKIPDLFADYNAKRLFHGWNGSMYYEANTNGAGKASDCIECGQCEDACPQKLPVRELLRKVAKEFGA